MDRDVECTAGRVTKINAIRVGVYCYQLDRGIASEYLDVDVR